MDPRIEAEMERIKFHDEVAAAPDYLRSAMIITKRLDRIERGALVTATMIFWVGILNATLLGYLIYLK